MKLFDLHQKVEKKVHEYFGYVEDWKVIPLDYGLEYHWFLDESDDSKVNHVTFAKNMEDFSTGEYYQNEIYRQRFLPKWVYRGEDYTMVVVDTNTDGNKFLQIFSNDLEIRGELLEKIELD